MSRISIQRRRLLAWLGSSALWAPMTALAQDKLARVGWLTLQTSGPYSEVTARGRGDPVSIGA